MPDRGARYLNYRKVQEMCFLLVSKQRVCGKQCEQAERGALAAMTSVRHLCMRKEWLDVCSFNVMGGEVMI